MFLLVFTMILSGTAIFLVSEAHWISAIIALSTVVSVLAGTVSFLYFEKKDLEKQYWAEIKKIEQENQASRDLLVLEYAHTITALEKAFGFVCDFKKLSESSPLISKQKVETVKKYLKDNMDKQQTPTVIDGALFHDFNNKDMEK
jgi:hypothetical protein